MQTLILDAVTKTISLVLAGAKDTNDCDIVVAWADDTGTTFVEGSTDLVSNGTTPVVVVAAPGTDTRRVIKSISIYNADVAPVTLSLRLISSGGTRIVAKVTLAVGDTWTTDGTFDDEGQMKYVGQALPFASAAEIATGTEAAKAMAPDQFAASEKNVRWLVFNLVEAGTDCETATNIAGDFVSPIAGTILQSDSAPFYLYATNSTAGTTGTMVVDVSINGTSIMTTNKLDFDTTEKTTTTASTQPDLTTTTIAVGDIVRIDTDAVHTTAAKGLSLIMAIRE